MEEVILNTIHATKVYRRATENMLKNENEKMQGLIKTLLSDMALIKVKLKIEITDEIATVAKGEVKRVSVAGERKRR